MTYEPIQTTQIDTSFGSVKLVINSSTFVQILTSPEDGWLKINGVDYHGRIEFERPDGKNWRIKMHDAGDHAYISGINLSRVDDWSKKLSTAARNKLVKTIAREVDDFLTTSQGTTHLRAADRRNAAAKLARAESQVEEAKRLLADAQAELEATRIELGLPVA